MSMMQGPPPQNMTGQLGDRYDRDIAGKAEQADVNYREGSEEAACAMCVNFQPPDRCHTVLGEISPAGICDQFSSGMNEEMTEQPPAGGPMMGGPQ